MRVVLFFLLFVLTHIHRPFSPAVTASVLSLLAKIVVCLYNVISYAHDYNSMQLAGMFSFFFLSSASSDVFNINCFHVCGTMMDFTNVITFAFNAH